MKIRLYSHVGQLSGYGRAGRELAMSLLAAGVDLEIRTFRVSPEEAAIALADYAPVASCLRHENELTEPDVAIVHTLPMDCDRALQLGLADYDGPVVAYTTWEGQREITPELAASLNGFDLIWTPGSTLPFHPRLSIPTYRIPHAFDPASLADRRGGVRVNLPLSTIRVDKPPPFVFYYVGAWNSRKNPAALLRAWAMAFDQDDDVRLLLWCTGCPEDTYAVALHATGCKAQDLPEIVFRNTPISDADILTLHREGDCYVTATRGEAWNLPAFDAMLAGRHIIHPAGMGSDAFLVESSANLYGGMSTPAAVDVRVSGGGREAGQMAMQTLGAHGMTSKTTWMEPDLLRLAETMRNVYLAKRRDLTLKYDPAERFSYATVGKLALLTLEHPYGPDSSLSDL